MLLFSCVNFVSFRCTVRVLLSFLLFLPFDLSNLNIARRRVS